MSWTEKRITLPFMAHNRSHSLTSTQYSNRDVEDNKVLSGYVRKLKTNRKKWFVLYSATATVPARLEYHDNERKWKSGFPPSREIVLKECFNICKKRDSRDSKNKHVIAIYTLDECLSILFEEEQELQNWLIQLLNMQKGRAEDGKIPRPNFENMWQVIVKSFKAEDAKNNFTLSGPHRLCVTMDDLKFFPNGSNTPISFPIVTLRSCVCNDRFFQLYTGRSSFSGAGTLSIYCEDKDISSNLNSAVHDAMEYNSQNRDKYGLPSHVVKSLRTKDSLVAEAPSSTSPSSAAAANSSSHRPRSESCSEIDKVKKIVPKHTAPSSTTIITTSHPRPSHSASIASRYRTTSEGNHSEFHRRKGKGNAVSGSPLSPSPGSYVSSESAGSCNSIDDADIPARHTSINEPGTTTIYEESSADSWVDPAVNRNISSESPPYSHTRTRSDNLVHYAPIEIRPAAASGSSNHNNNSFTSSTVTANSSSRTMEPIGVFPTVATASSQHTNYPSTNYSSIVNHQHPTAASMSSEYMVMTPTSGNTSSTSSLQRHSSLDQAEQRRLQLLGLSEEAIRGMSVVRGGGGNGGSSGATITSPSSQSSYNPLDDVEDHAQQQNSSAYHAMSPLSSVSKSIPIRKVSASTKEEDEYMNMSPAVSAKATTTPQQKSSVNTNGAKSRHDMAIPLQATSPPHRAQNGDKRQDYEVMSPVSLDPEKLRRISEEDSSPSVPTGKEQRLNSLASTSIPENVKKNSTSSRRRDSSKRHSFCSDVDDVADHFMELQQNHPAMEANKTEEVEDENTDYLTMDYNRVASMSAAAAIPIPSALSSSPSSSGTPNSLDTSRFPPDFHFETKAVSYLRADDDNGSGGRRSTMASQANNSKSLANSTAGPLPLRAYSMSSGNRAAVPSSSSSSVSGRSRTSSITSSRFMDIPPSRNKLSPSMFGKTNSSGHGGDHHTRTGQSPNIMSRLDNWFRSRTGSVPSRPALNQRRRHRTQSEGEKDSPENHEASVTISPDGESKKTLTTQEEDET